MFGHRRQGLFLSENVDDIKMAGKKQNTAPMWKKLMKTVEINEPTLFPDHVNCGPTTWKDMLKKCVERYCESANKKVEQLYKV